MSGFFIQGSFGPVGNFEVVVPSRLTPGLVHYWRDNNSSNLTWSNPTRFGSALGFISGGVSLIESSFGSPGNLELVVSTGGQLYYFWRDSGLSLTWNGPFYITGGVSGVPGLIQSRFGTRGNFEVVVPASDRGLVHYWRNNDDPSLPWNGPTSFGRSLGPVDSVSLIQSNFGDPGNLEVVASSGGQAYHFWRDSGPSFNWNGPFLLSGIFGCPSLIQSRFGSQGNFELVVSTPSGGLAHYWRNNDDPGLPWSAPTPFTGLIRFGLISLIQSNFGNSGNLEVMAGTFDPNGGELAHVWRDSGPSSSWSFPLIAETGV
jgi:hypothetical protein